MRVLIAGAVAWEDKETIRKELLSLPHPIFVLHGDAPGADELGGKVAKELGLEVKVFRKNEEDYRRFNRGAWKGLNERMLASGVDFILAFHPAIEKSRGTKHLLGLAKDLKIPSKIIPNSDQTKGTKER